MTDGGTSGSPFEAWQHAQRQLHALERQLAQAARDAANGIGSGVPRDLAEQARALRLEVDALFPAAMKELEERVRALQARRPTLGDL